MSRARGREQVSAVVYVETEDGEQEVEFEATVWSGEDLEAHTATPPEYLAKYGNEAWFAEIVDQELWDQYRAMREDSAGDWADVFQGDRD